MPTRLPERPRAKSIRAGRNAIDDERPNASVDRRQPKATEKHDAIDTVDWLALWALSLAVSAMFIAALVYFGEGDATGAAAVLAGTAGIIAIAMFMTEAPGRRG